MFKKVTLAALAVAASATFASADASYFGLVDDQRDGVSVLQIDLVRAASDGFVQVETFGGRILGTESVNAGANGDVRVPLGSGANTDLVAKLIIDGEVVDQEHIEVR